MRRAWPPASIRRRWRPASLLLPADFPGNSLWWRSLQWGSPALAGLPGDCATPSSPSGYPGGRPGKRLARPLRRRLSYQSAETGLNRTTAPAERDVARNRAASYNYDLLERLEAGIVLVGTEVKSLREGRASLRQAFALVRNGELWLVNLHIPEYLPGGPFNHAPLRDRKLLLRRREIDRLAGLTQQKRMTLVPLRIYFKNGRAKCELALARGKQQWDRRRAERDKEALQEVRAALRRSKRR